MYPVDYLHEDKYFLYNKFSVIVCLNMQMRYYLLKYALICIHFQKQKSEHWIKPG